MEVRSQSVYRRADQILCNTGQVNSFSLPDGALEFGQLSNQIQPTTMTKKKSSNPNQPKKKSRSTIEFQWDQGNLDKLDLVRQSGRYFSVDELESVFVDPFKDLRETYPDPVNGEKRYIMVGTTNQNQVVSVVFVFKGILNDKIRIFNCWKTKGSVLKEYHAQKTDRESEERTRPEAESPE